jgi:hypothetical protein
MTVAKALKGDGVPELGMATATHFRGSSEAGS